MDFKGYLIANEKKLDSYLAASFYGHATHPDMDRYLYGPLEAYTANGGKRHRPLICLLACEAVGGNAENALCTAIAIEHFHTAALIHDDIADEALLRRDKPSLHITQGIGLAVNDGDLSLSLVTGSVINDPCLPDPIKLRVLREVIDMTARTVEGQALDIGWARDNRFDLTTEDYLAMAYHKTAFYSGGVPLATGAIIGGGSEEQIVCLREYGMSTGLSFQIQDDLLNLTTSKKTAQKDYRGDITEGKRTLIAVHAIQHSADKDELIEILSSHTTDYAMLDRAVQIMQEAGSLEYARNYAMDIVKDSKALVLDSLPASEKRDLLVSMADFFVNRSS